MFCVKVFLGTLINQLWIANWTSRVKTVASFAPASLILLIATMLLTVMMHSLQMSFSCVSWNSAPFDHLAAVLKTLLICLGQVVSLLYVKRRTKFYFESRFQSRRYLSNIRILKIFVVRQRLDASQVIFILLENPPKFPSEDTKIYFSNSAAVVLSCV